VSVLHSRRATDAACICKMAINAKYTRSFLQSTCFDRIKPVLKTYTLEQ